MATEDTEIYISTRTFTDGRGWKQTPWEMHAPNVLSRLSFIFVRMGTWLAVHAPEGQEEPSPGQNEPSRRRGEWHPGYTDHPRQRALQGQVETLALPKWNHCKRLHLPLQGAYPTAVSSPGCHSLRSFCPGLGSSCPFGAYSSSYVVPVVYVVLVVVCIFYTAHTNILVVWGKGLTAIRTIIWKSHLSILQKKVLENLLHFLHRYHKVPVFIGNFGCRIGCRISYTV